MIAEERKPTVLVFKNGPLMETAVVRAVPYTSDKGEFVTIAIDIDDDEADNLRRMFLRLKAARGKAVDYEQSDQDQAGHAAS